MTVRINKSAFNIREKLSELERPIGVKGNELMRAETAQDARDLVSAGRKNILINGAMVVAQRGTSVTGQTSAAYHTVDRFTLGPATAGTWSMSQSTDAPDNFAYSLKMNCTTANTSLSAASMLYYAQKVEGNNLQHLGFGTSNAKPLTFSFWVKSNKTGIYTSELYNSDSTRQISKTFTIDTANTWEYKVINFPADTTGSFGADNGLGLWVFIHLGSGSDRNSGTLNDDAWAAVTNADRISSSNVNLADSTSNEIFMTGWQLEVGSNATEFEHRSYGEELALCQRYFQGYNAADATARAAISYNNYDTDASSTLSSTTLIGSGTVVDADDARIVLSFPVAMRTRPTVTGTDLRLTVGNTLYNTATTLEVNTSSVYGMSMLVDNASSMTAGQCAHLLIKGNGDLFFNAEL